MSTPDIPDDALATPEDVRAALAQRFVDNALAGRDEDNDDMIEQLIEWRRNRDH